MTYPISLAGKVALVVGGAGGITIVTGERLPAPVELELVWLLESEGHLFLRQRVRR